MKTLIKLTAVMLLFVANAQISIAGDVWDGETIATGFYSGNGTKNNPYTIYTGSQFAYFYTQMANSGRTFEGQYIKIMNDIDMGSNDINCLKIGSNSNIFKGELDGADHTISLYCYNSGGAWNKLLGELYGTVHNIYFGVHSLGLATIKNGGEVYNCYFALPTEEVVRLEGGTIANCACGYAYWQNTSKYGGASGVCVAYSTSEGTNKCLNCDFEKAHFISYGNSEAYNYGSSAEHELCGNYTDNERNQWIADNTTSNRVYKSWPLTFAPTYPSYNISITFVDNTGLSNYETITLPSGSFYNLPNPTGYENKFLGWYYKNEIVSNVSPTDNIVCVANWEINLKQQPTFLSPETAAFDKNYVKYQWKKTEAPTQYFENPQTVSTFTTEVDNMVLVFDYSVKQYYSGGRYGDDYPGYVAINGEQLIYVATNDNKTYTGTMRYVCPTAGEYKITKDGATLTNMYLEHPASSLTGETTTTLSYAHFTPKNGLYFCDVIYNDVHLHSDTLNTSSLFKQDGNIYYPIDGSSVALLKADTGKKVCIVPQAVTYEGASYSVTALSDYAFADCTNLESIICMVPQPILVKSSASFGVPTSVVIYVPSAKVNTYKAASVWKNYTIRAKDSYPAKLYNGNCNETDVTVDLPNIPTSATAENYLCFINEIIRNTSEESSIIPNIVFKVENGEWTAKQIDLTDAKPFYSPSDISAESVTYTRTFSNTNWQSLYIPYNLSYNDWSDKVRIAELAGVHTYEDAPTIIEFITVKSGELMANTPYVIRAIESSSTPITFTSTDRVLKASPEEETRFISCSSPRWTYKFFGNYQTLPGDRAVELEAKVLGSGKLINTSSPVKPMRFYLVKERSSNGYWGAPSRGEDAEEILVMIDGVLVSSEEAASILDAFIDNGDETMYNVQGIKVGSDYKGIVIKNGKKIILK